MMDMFEIAQILLDEDPTEILARAGDERLFLIDSFRAAEASILNISEDECCVAFRTHRFPTFDMAFLHFYSQALYKLLLQETMLFQLRTGASLRESIARTCRTVCNTLQHNITSGLDIPPFAMLLPSEIRFQAMPSHSKSVDVGEQPAANV